MTSRSKTLNFALAAIAFAASLPAALRAQSAIEKPEPQPGIFYSASVDFKAKDVFRRHASIFTLSAPQPQKFKLDLSPRAVSDFAPRFDSSRFLIQPSYSKPGGDGMKAWADGMANHWTQKFHLPQFSIDDRAFRLSHNWRLTFEEPRQVRIMRQQMPRLPGQQVRPFVPGFDYP